MKLTALVLVSTTLTTFLAAQTPDYNTFKAHNDRSATQGSDPNTGFPRPLIASRAAGYVGAAGVAAGTRVWMHVPQLRFQGGHVGTDLISITGMTQNIFAGPAVPASSYPLTGHTFTTGLGPVASTAATHGFEHAPTGSDIVNFPGAPLVFPTRNTITAVSFTLTTPIAVQNTELVLFMEFAGGESMISTTNGQTIASDWWGRGINAGVNYAGFAEGTPYAIRGYAPVHLPQIGMMIDEPVFTATGEHGNNYKGRTNEDLLAIGAIAPDYITPHQRDTAGACLFFNVQGGARFANGQFVVWTDFGPTSFPLVIPTIFGNLLIDPTNPLLLMVASISFNLDGTGSYDQGPSNPIPVPLLPPAVAGMVLKFQAVLVEPGFAGVALSNASGMKILP